MRRGISADITQGVINRMDEIVRHKAAKLFIAIGINDISRSIPIDTIWVITKLFLKEWKRNLPILKCTFRHNSVFWYSK